MSFGISIDFQEQLSEMASRMASYQASIAIEPDEEERLTDSIASFNHTTRLEKQFVVGGVDGSGDFPCLQFADSFVYVATANAVAYQTSLVSGLTELDHGIKPLKLPIWLPAPSAWKDRCLDEAFEKIVGHPVIDVIRNSDYISLKAAECQTSLTAESLLPDLIRPPAHDAANLGVQLRTTAELGCALRLIELENPPKYVFIDTTMSLPLLDNRRRSLFFEHVKRLCCVEARSKGVGLFALSKSHGLPRIDLIETIARNALSVEEGTEAEHWFLRIPNGLTLTDGRRIPPPGAVSYVVRFHRNVPVLRLDMDIFYWNAFVKSDDPVQQLENETQIFQDLDYSGHDVRCYGYPYPIKAGHDQASMTQAQRTMLRIQVEQALRRTKSVNPRLIEHGSFATGHGGDI